MTSTESPVSTSPGRYTMVMYNLKAYEYLTKMGTNMTLDRFIESMEIPRDFLPNEKQDGSNAVVLLSNAGEPTQEALRSFGYCGPTAKFLTEMSWVDQVVHFISFGYGRYHETEAPLQFIEQPNGDPHIVLIKTMVKSIYHPEENSLRWKVCGDLYEYHTPSFHEVRLFLDQVVVHFRKKIHKFVQGASVPYSLQPKNAGEPTQEARRSFDPNTYTVTDEYDKLTDLEKQEVLKKLSKRRGLTPQFSFLWL